MKILIFEDNKNIAEAMRIVLSENGHNVNLAFDTSSVLQKIKKIKPKLIILDFYLSKTNGGQLSKKIKEQRDFQSTPIVMISASTEPQTAAIKCHIDDFLLKPFEIKDLLSIVNKYDQKN